MSSNSTDLSTKINNCQAAIEAVAGLINNRGIPSNEISHNHLYDAIYALIPVIPNDFSLFRDRLRDQILPNLKIKDMNTTDRYGMPITVTNTGINPYFFGQVISTINLFEAHINHVTTSSTWATIHSEIRNVSKTRFEDGHFADAVESAFKEINSRVKEIVKDRANVELDGAPLMRKAFSKDNPIIKIGDLTTESGRNVQQGYMEMFAGAMIGIRNPKAHSNQTITQMDAIRKLNFASMLMYKIDNEL